MTKTKIVALSTALLSTLALGTANAESTPQRVYEGEGWQALYVELPSYKIKSIDTSIPFKFIWENEYSRDLLRPYVEDTAAQLEYITGADFIVSQEIDPRTSYTCGSQPKHTITMFAYYRPVGANRPGVSKAYPCYNTANDSAWGGMITMDNEYWEEENWFSADPVVNEAYIRNAVTHEIAHVLGLDHPNEEDANGVNIPLSCLNGGTGLQPVMCSPNGGYRNAVDGGEFTEWDIAGLQQLVANHDIPE